MLLLSLLLPVVTLLLLLGWTSGGSSPTYSGVQGTALSRPSADVGQNNIPELLGAELLLELAGGGGGAGWVLPLPPPPAAAVSSS